MKFWKELRNWGMGISLIGLIAAIYLSLHTTQLLNGESAGTSLCNISSRMNCDTVALSDASRLFGIPLASFVVGWMLWMIGLFFNLRTRRRAQVGFIAALFSVLYSLYLIFQMLFVIHSLCLFCLGVDAVNLGQAILFFLLAKRLPDDGATPPGAEIKTLLVLPALILISIFFLSPSKTEQDIHSAEMADSFLASTLAQNPIDTTLLDRTLALSPKRNNPKAPPPIEIFEFSDFECPHCATGEKVMAGIQNRYPEQVALYLLPFPLDSSCNPLVKAHMHPLACDLARLNICALEQGLAKETHAFLFRNQGKITSLPGAMHEIGLDKQKAEACMKNSQTAERLQRAIENGKTLNVESTPTFLINGYRVSGPWTVDVIQSLIEKIKPRN